MRPSSDNAIKMSGLVSIHASVKDSTSDIEHCYLLNSVSIHASVKDATNALAVRAIMETVSIHASVKDATNQNVSDPKSYQFQSTHL